MRRGKDASKHPGGYLSPPVLSGRIKSRLKKLQYHSANLKVGTLKMKKNKLGYLGLLGLIGLLGIITGNGAFCGFYGFFGFFGFFGEKDKETGAYNKNGYWGLLGFIGLLLMAIK
jgi:hypothetical protein